jgi:hypothetical protein
MNIASEIFKRLKQANKLAAVTGCLLSVVSTIFTCRLLASFAQGGTDTYLYYAFGIGIQAAQSLSLFYAGFLVFTGRKEKATFPICIFILLFVLSLCGTIGFMAVGNDKQKVKAVHSENTYAVMRGRLTNLDDQIKHTQEQIEEYTQRSWLSKGVQPANAMLDNLITQREEAYNSVMDFKPTDDGDALYRALGGLTGADSESCKRALFFMYAIALDLSSGLMLWMSAGGAMGGIRFQNRRREQADPEYDQPELTRQEPPQFIGGDGENDQYEIHRKPLDPDKVYYETTSPDPVYQAPKFYPDPNQAEPAVYPEEQPPYSTSRVGSVEPEAVSVAPESGPGVVPETKFGQYKAALLNGMKKNGSTIGRAAIVDQIGISNRQAVEFHKRLKEEGLVKVENQKTYPLFGWEEVSNA